MLTDLLSRHKQEFLPGLHTELRAQCSRTRGVSFVSGNLMGNTRQDTSGVCCRVYKNGVYGFSSAAEYDDENVKNVIRAAGENAEFMDSRVRKGRPAFPAIPYSSRMTDAHINEVSQKTYIDYLKALDDYIVGKYPNLASRTLMMREDSMEKLLVTSDGVDSHFAAPRSYIYVILSALTPAGVPVELFKAYGGRGSFDMNFSDPAELYGEIDKLYESVMKKREGVYADAGVKTVILGSELAGMIAHEAVGHTVEADLVLGGSVAGPNLGKQVASPIVSLTDFANEAFGETAPLPVYVDDEGTPAVDAPLIKDGILVGYMNSRETAERFGMKPQGNARAFAFSDEPLIRMRNTAVHPGKDKIEDMIASIDDGYYLVNTNNGQADTTGEFMFGVTEGYEIKHGKLGRAILDTTVSGVAFEMLKTVDMISDKVEWTSSGFCGKKQPMPVGMGGPEMRCKIMIGGR
ncbi:MAG: TldD/PmbA family protein [Clostridia bacterium]|jgi:TldD protein|nr:TldD/PmbA family protein [Clostridia bacterium]MBP5238033.1 TldD/PmbA family protein [Clostridia bacterium]MBP5755365.1 TldD/PmbA family protein [Clostridia bacterium]